MRPIVYPADWLFRDPVPPLTDFGRRLLAEGDSWFTIGTLNLPEASNLLFKLEFTLSTAIVNCAYPGDTLQHVVDNVHDRFFDRLLRKRNFASYWEAIIFSAGGNDLIDALRAPPFLNGLPSPQDSRILLTPDEAGGTSADVARYVSEPGWNRLINYLRENLSTLVKHRDEGPSRGRPIFLHTYSVPTVRAIGTVGSPQGWLYPSLVAYRIPVADRQPLCDLLFDRLRLALLALDGDASHTSGLPNVHVFDSASLVPLVRAGPKEEDSMGDWVNEIHPSPAGYAKISRVFGAWIEGILTHYP